MRSSKEEKNRYNTDVVDFASDKKYVNVLSSRFEMSLKNVRILIEES